ncbi:MAG: hypothetical protein ACOYMW_15620 [Candidatus Competibacteraceae bacterium]
MNPELVATFTEVSAGLLSTFGAPALRTHALVSTPVQAVLDSAVAPVGDYGERMESRSTIMVLRASGAALGDTVTLNGTVWHLAQLLDDDGFILKFAVRDTA